MGGHLCKSRHLQSTGAEQRPDHLCKSCTPLCSHRVVVLAEGEDLGVVPERLAQSQLGDGLHGQPQQVGTQRGVLSLRGGRPLPHQLLHQLREESGEYV